MATFVMQALGCDVAALNTVHFSKAIPPFQFKPFCSASPFSLPKRSYFTALIPRTSIAGNHTGYHQVKGTKASAGEIREIYDGLCQSHLTDFDMLLSGYAPSAEAVEAVGVIARDLKFRSANKPGSFFWSTFTHLTGHDEAC